MVAQPDDNKNTDNTTTATIDENHLDKHDGGNNSLSKDHHTAIAGWKARKEQLYRQQESVFKANDDAEKVNLLSLSKHKKVKKR